MKRLNIKFTKKKNKYYGFTGKEIKIINNNIVVGIKNIKDAEDWRVLGVKLIKFIKSNDIKAKILIKKGYKEFAEGLFLGSYNFDKYKSKKEKKIKNLLINVSKEANKEFEEVIKRTEAQKLVRDWVNTTPEDAYSESIYKEVQEMFKNTSIKVEKYGEKNLKENNMNCHLAVNRASRHEAMTIKLTYEPKNYKEHHIFIGKGLTYDSGGLSLKPGDYMTTMKADKAGAMTVWGLMKYISENKSKNKITVYMGMAENMVNGSAYKPDDVLVAMNGTTIHVKNTDAEGRLVLFDNLCLAQKENKDITTIHTLATLTGAAVRQFGDEAAGLVSFNDKLKQKVIKEGNKAGEIYMDAAFHKYMLDSVKDDLADISNIGDNPNMGCQKAGLFLTNAITKKNKMKYIHWDIAGPAFVPKSFGHNPKDATGFGVRTLINFCQKK